MEERLPLLRMKRATWNRLRRERLMLSHARPSAVLADAQRPSQKRSVQPVDVISKIGVTASVPPETYVVSDCIGRASDRHAIDSARGSDRGEPARIFGLCDQYLDRLSRIRAGMSSQFIP